MSLPLRLPHCYPARPQRAVLLFPYFRAPVTPPPSPAYLPGIDPVHKGGAPEDCSEEEEAWIYAIGYPGRGLNGDACASPQGRESPGLPRARHAPRSLSPPAEAPSTVRPAESRRHARRPQLTRPAFLGCHPSTPHGFRRALDGQPGASGTPAAGGKEPGPSVNGQMAWGVRRVEKATLQLPVPSTLTRCVAGHSARQKKSEGPAKPFCSSSGKYQGNCSKVSLNTEKDWKSLDESWRAHIKEP